MTKKSDSTQQKIISSAEILFYSKGVSQTTQQELANLAGVNRGLIHYYFGSKEHLALQISRRFTSSFYTAVNELFFEGRAQRGLQKHHPGPPPLQNHFRQPEF